MIKAVIRGESVTLEQAVWLGASPGLLEKLEAATEAAIAEVRGDDPAPELTVAEAVAADLRGRVIRYFPDDDADDPNLPPVIYSSAP